MAHVRPCHKFINFGSSLAVPLGGFLARHRGKIGAAGRLVTLSQNQAVDSRRIASRMGNCNSSSAKGSILFVVCWHALLPKSTPIPKRVGPKRELRPWLRSGFQVNPHGGKLFRHPRDLVETAAN